MKKDNPNLEKEILVLALPIPIEVKGQETFLFTGKEDLPISDMDKISIIGGNGSGKTLLCEYIEKRFLDDMESRLTLFINEKFIQKVSNKLEENDSDFSTNLSPGRKKKKIVNAIAMELNDVVKYYQMETRGNGVVLIFDNAFLGLDARTFEYLLKIISRLDATLIFSGHDELAKDVLRTVCNKFILLKSTDTKVSEIIIEENLNGVIGEEIEFKRMIRMNRENISKMRHCKRMFKRIMKETKGQDNRNILEDLREINEDLFDGYLDLKKTNAPTLGTFDEIIELMRDLQIDAGDYNKYKKLRGTRRVLRRIQGKLRNEKLSGEDRNEFSLKYSQKIKDDLVAKAVVDLAEARGINSGSISKKEYAKEIRFLENNKLTSRNFTPDIVDSVKKITDTSLVPDENFNQQDQMVNQSKLIDTSLSLMLCDVNENKENSSSCVKELALYYSNKFSNIKGKKEDDINLLMRCDGIVSRQQILGALFSNLRLRKLQRSGQIGHVNLIMDSNEGKTEGIISISSTLGKEINTKIEIDLESINKIGELKVEIEIDQRVGLNKKIILVNTVEKYLQYNWNVRDEKNTLVLFPRLIKDELTNNLKKKNILSKTDILIIDCDGELNSDLKMDILRNCRPYGTSIEGHFLFIEINNSYRELSIEKHVFNDWIKVLRRQSRTTEQANSAGLKNIIKYYHSSDGIRNTQDTKRATNIQPDEKIRGYKFLKNNERYSDLQFWKDSDFQCLESEIIDCIEIFYGNNQIFIKNKILNYLKKFDQQIYENSWGEAKYTAKYLNKFLQEGIEDLSLGENQKMIHILLEDLELLCNYLNNGRTNILDIGESNKVRHQYNDALTRKIIHAARRETQLNASDLKFFRQHGREIKQDYFFTMLILIESGDLSINLEDKVRKRLVDDLIYARKAEDFGIRSRQKRSTTTIYRKIFSPLIKLKHDQVEFLFNEKLNWKPSLDWKISHLKKVAEGITSEERKLILCELWALLEDEGATENAWEMIQIYPRGWVFGILMQLYNANFIEYPKEINPNTYEIIEKWIRRCPWDINQLINCMKLFPEPNLNNLYLEELNRNNFDTNKELYKKIWKEDQETEESLDNWFKEIKENLTKNTN